MEHQYGRRDIMWKRSLVWTEPEIMQPRPQDFSVAVPSWRHFIEYGNLVNSLAGYEELAGGFESIKND